MTPPPANADDSDAGIGWAAGRAVVARGAAAWSQALSPSPERERQILDARARRLALVPPLPGAARTGDVVLFTRARGRFAIEARFVHEVFHLGESVPLPGAPAFVAGVASFRGEFLVLVDLCPVLGLGAAGAGPVREVLVLGEGEVEFGIIADEVSAVAGLGPAALHDPPAAHDAAIRGITADGVMMLDGAALIADPRLVIGESDGRATPVPTQGGDP